MPYDELIHYDHTKSDSHVPALGLTVHAPTANPHGVMPPDAQVYHAPGDQLGSREHPYQGAEVTVEATQPAITGTHGRLTGYRNNITGEVKSYDEMMAERQSDNQGEGATRRPYISSETGESFGQYEYSKGGHKNYLGIVQKPGAQVYSPIYDESLTTAEGPEIPVGKEEMPAAAAVRQPGVMEGIKRYGSPEDLKQAEALTQDKTILESPDRKPINLAPKQTY